MKRAAAIVLWVLLVGLAGATLAPPTDEPTPATPSTTASRFAYVDAYIDSAEMPLAAYQFELSASGPGVTLVGVEGGDAPAFAEPPYYDPQANLQHRIIIAAFNTGSDLPRGRTRVARIMVRLSGTRPAMWSAKLDVAASSDAKPISAQIQVSQGEAP